MSEVKISGTDALREFVEKQDHIYKNIIENSATAQFAKTVESYISGISDVSRNISNAVNNSATAMINDIAHNVTYPLQNIQESIVETLTNVQSITDSIDINTKRFISTVCAPSIAMATRDMQTAFLAHVATSLTESVNHISSFTDSIRVLFSGIIPRIATSDSVFGSLDCEGILSFVDEYDDYFEEVISTKKGVSALGEKVPQKLKACSDAVVINIGDVYNKTFNYNFSPPQPQKKETVFNKISKTASLIFLILNITGKSISIHNELKPNEPQPTVINHVNINIIQKVEDNNLSEEELKALKEEIEAFFVEYYED